MSSEEVKAAANRLLNIRGSYYLDDEKNDFARLVADAVLVAEGYLQSEPGRKITEERHQYRRLLESIRDYDACEGYGDDSGTLVVGLAWKGQLWGPSILPKYEAYELAEKVDEWLKKKIDPVLYPESQADG